MFNKEPLLLRNRMRLLQAHLTYIENTSSIVEKRACIDRIPVELKDDFMYILEILDNRYPLGYTYSLTRQEVESANFDVDSTQTFKEYIDILWEPVRKHDLSNEFTHRCSLQTAPFFDFIEPIVNRTLRLGIGKSILGTTEFSPMLAKQFDENILTGKYAVTLKLDGNRCIAYYDDIAQQWRFMSRNNKLKDQWKFDMTGFDTSYIYDGEILSLTQTLQNLKLAKTLHDSDANSIVDDTFNQTSGQLNRKAPGMTMIYNIFDIMCDKPYYERRQMLEEHTLNNGIYYDVVIVPTIGYVTKYDVSTCYDILDMVTKRGAEGIMLNNIDAVYEHKRCSDLIKFKKIKEIDMEVIGVLEGSGKYEDAIGALVCKAFYTDGRPIYCNIGTGLSDDQRYEWYAHPEKIKGSIVEVAYQNLSKSSCQWAKDRYSLRFPRLIRVRSDKDTILD